MSEVAYEEMNPVCISTKTLAREYIGKMICYLTASDIDKSGRGYYFKRYMFVDEVIGNEFHSRLDDRFVRYKDILRIKIMPKEADRESGIPK